MSNTLTNLIADVFAALDVVSRELTGFIPAVARDPKADRIALNQTLRSPVAPANAAGKNITPAMAFPAAADQTIGNKDITITKSRAFPFSWSGEEQYSVNQGGPGYLTIRQDQIAQAIRAAVNEIEADLADAAYKGASRAIGTAGTTPFDTAGDYSDAAESRKILDDNGAPQSDRHLIINTSAGARIRAKQAQAQMVGDISVLRQGVLTDQAGFAIRESAQVKSVTKGTGVGYLVNNNPGPYAVGATSIAVDTGAGTVLAGDIVTFDGDTNKYVVATALAAGTLVLAAPGLRQTLADNTPMTVGDSFSANVGFSRNAIVLATRLPALPQEKDMASERITITDPRTGLSFELAVYPGYRMVLYELGINWGVRAVKTEHIVTQLG